MSEVSSLLGPRGRCSQIAREMRVHVGTVWCWKDAGSIPPWRRRAVLDVVNRLNIEVPAEVIAYLAQAA